MGLTGEGHRRFLSDWYAGEAPGSWADGLVFQGNPATGDRRISGSAASLAGLRPDAAPDEVDAALARIFLAHAIAAGWGGVPGGLERRRAGPDQRPRLGRRAGS